MAIQNVKTHNKESLHQRWHEGTQAKYCFKEASHILPFMLIESQIFMKQKACFSVKLKGGLVKYYPTLCKDNVQIESVVCTNDTFSKPKSISALQNVIKKKK
jgi:hypothetical protein